jgi:O-antigen ligase
MYKKNNFKSYIPVILFVLVIISPLITTGLPLKKYTRLNEIFLLVIIVFIFMSSAVSHKPFSLKKIEQLLLLIGFNLTISTLYGYLFLDIIVSVRDFYPIYNTILLLIYFRCGTFFNYRNISGPIVRTTLFFSIVLYNIISIMMIFPWGLRILMSYFVPAHVYEKHISFFNTHLYAGSQRIVGVLGNSNSSAIMTVILLILVIGWILFMPIQSFFNKLLMYVLLFSTLLTLGLSFSRTAIISFFIGIIYLLFSSSILKKRTIKLISIFMLVGFSSIIIMNNTNKFFIIPYDHLRGMIPKVSGIDANISSLETRFNAWMKGLKKYSLSPVFGTGTANATNIQSDKLRLEGIKHFYSPHNEYINILITSGILGLFLYLLLFISVYNKADSISKKNTDNFRIFIANSTKAIIIALAVFNMAVGFWDNAIIPPLLMLLFGTMYANANRDRL